MLSSLHGRITEYTKSDRVSIIIWTAGFKLMMIPLYIRSAKIKRKLGSMNSLLKALNSSVAKTEILKARFHGKSSPQMSHIKREIDMAKVFIYERHGISSSFSVYSKLLSPLAQIPFWMYASLSLRKMSGLNGWIPNWIDVNLDNTLQLWDLNQTGFVSLAMYLGLLQVLNSYIYPVPNFKIKYLLGGLSALTVPIATLLPESVVIFWCTSTTWTFIQNLMFESSIMDKILGRKEGAIRYKKTN
eukprot:NODE_67_length_25542_cov_1.476831.p14 type:complete len:244 gc:universal NODE_67_length_25542_cov_1.476831:20574-19843(-)